MIESPTKKGQTESDPAREDEGGWGEERGRGVTPRIGVAVLTKSTLAAPIGRGDRKG